ncbi:MAG: hypothetical protein ACOYB1_11770 [Limnohabitans sp.]
MNTQATQHQPSAIEVLSDVLSHAHDDTEQEIAEAIASIWIPIFRSELNFAIALDAVKISHENVNARDMCDRYLDAMRGMK